MMCIAETNKKALKLVVSTIASLVIQNLKPFPNLSLSLILLLSWTEQIQTLHTTNFTKITEII